MNEPIWLTRDYAVPQGSTWTENENYVLVHGPLGNFVVGELKTRPIADLFKAKLKPA